MIATLSLVTRIAPAQLLEEDPEMIATLSELAAER